MGQLKTIVVMVLLFQFCISAVGQDVNEELVRLRQVLNVPGSTAITLADSPGLPDARPLKVYLATGLDMGVRQNFRKWIDEWNHWDGKKHGLLEIVSDISEADIILARYTALDKVSTATQVDSYSAPGTVYDPASNSVVTRPVPQTYSTTYSIVPAYAYILARRPNGLEIEWRYVGQTSVRETKKSGFDLMEDLAALMKQRSKHRKK